MILIFQMFSILSFRGSRADSSPTPTRMIGYAAQNFLYEKNVHRKIFLDQAIAIIVFPDSIGGDHG